MAVSGWDKPQCCHSAATVPQLPHPFAQVSSCSVPGPKWAPPVTPLPGLRVLLGTTPQHGAGEEALEEQGLSGPPSLSTTATTNPRG